MSPLFSRRTIIAAADTLQSLGHDGIDRFLLELGLSKELAQKGVTLSKRTASLAKVAVDQPQLLTAEGGKLSNALVFRAQSLCERTPSVDFKLRQAFEEAMQAEGFVLATQPEGAIVRISHTVEPRRPRRKKVVELGLETVVDRVGDRTKLEVSPRRVFLVHGHDSSARESVARFLEKLSFEVIILHEKPNRGKTLIEKFESNSDVGFAVVLLTPDDFGSARDAAANPRARQNVVLEHRAVS